MNRASFPDPGETGRSAVNPQFGARRRIDSPIGLLVLGADPRGRLTSLAVGDGPRPDPRPCPPPQASPEPGRQWRAGADPTPATGVLDETARQLAEYFAGRRLVFTVPLALDGTPFQQAVWAALGTVEWGRTVTYGELAARVGRPGAARAVGHANARNPVAVIVPCHRVVGADGTLTGYGGGLDAKRLLLDLERTGRGRDRPRSAP